MVYVVVHQLNKVIAWTNKCGGSSVRRQLLEDLNDESLLKEVRENKTDLWELVMEKFEVNIHPTKVPQNYKFEWYVRDPFYRTLSCFINRKIRVDKDDPDLTFRDFALNLAYFRSKSHNVRGHTEPQVNGYFEAPWNIIDINLASFSFHEKMNSTKYVLGDKEEAWGIPSRDLLINNQTYSELSFYSTEISKAIKEFYKDDYAMLSGRIKLV